ncbi:glycoside-pentoside-hexuronide (GPH):cation symporter [Neobacillus cucumis]|uniref:MFS transporter n=1 Tax=Neobacillus cucumis TaxID=1740721 RepID=UPI0020406F0B|nr:glycoside-pentoside-hexuronide (GPH):cation symporter [Neobacillus cucumis]MCM3724626.1 glycoside-pentoside-hexuronide (GPH):cation symporter [Neobacillus cucumis]
MSQSASQKKIDPNIISSNVKVRPFGFRDKIGYMLGDFGNDFFFILVSSYLMVYYTDVYGISAAFVGVLFLAARLWDAIADVTWGRFIDTRKPSKHGKFKPWILRMSFPLVISGVLMFIHIPGMSYGFYEAYAFVTYILWGTLYSTVNIPYGSMASVITIDPIERTSLSTYRTMGAMLASLMINAVGPLLIFVDNKASANGFLMAAVIFGILAYASYLASYKLSTERIVLEENEGPKAKLGHTIKGLLKNKPLIAILGASLIFMMSTMLIGSVNVYLFKDYFNNAAALSIVGIIQTVTVFIAIPIVKPLVSKFGKKETTTVGMLLAAAVYILLFFLPNLTAIQYISLTAIGMFGYAFFNIMIWAFVTDVIDYHEFLTGLREDGTVYSLYSFARKVGQAIAGGISGFAITAIGYHSTREVQTESTLEGIYALATIVPGVIYLLIFLILVFLYPLTKQRMKQLTIDLKEQKITRK